MFSRLSYLLQRLAIRTICAMLDLQSRVRMPGWMLILCGTIVFQIFAADLEGSLTFKTVAIETLRSFPFF